MNKREELIPIGIASSAMKSSGYDWKKTIELANRLDISVIQFHLNQYTPEVEWDKDLTSQFYQIYLHLPEEFNPSHPIFSKIKSQSSKPIIIQHERYLKNKDILFLKKDSFTLGFENDNLSSLQAYVDQLQKLHAMGINISAVIDLPRFYHQFHAEYKKEDIYNYIIRILNRCKTLMIPVIIHAIDISDYNKPDQSSWVPIFAGILPWGNFLSFVIEENIPVKSIIFEYEDVPITEKSVYSLREWLKKKIRY